MGKEAGLPRQISALQGEIALKAEILLQKVVQRVQLMDLRNILYYRDPKRGNLSASKPEEYEDSRDLRQIVENPQPELLPEHVIAIRTYSVIESQVRLGQNTTSIETSPFNFSPLVFLGGKETTYGKIMDTAKKSGADLNKMLEIANAIEGGNRSGWEFFKPSDPMIIARDKGVYSLRPGDLIAPEPKTATKTTI